MKKLFILICLVFITGCSEEQVETIDKTSKENSSIELMNYTDALILFEEGMEVEILDIETGITYNVRRIQDSFKTIADVETLTTEDTDNLLETSDGNWSIVRRAVIVTIDDVKIAASIAPFEHSGDEDYEFGDIIDNRNGGTGTGPNLDSIKGNGMNGVVDIYFYNSPIPGLTRLDERHQEMVLKAYEYED